MKIKSKLTLTFSTLTAVALLLVSAVGYRHTSQQLMQSLQREMEQVVNAQVNMLDGWLDGKIKILQITGETVMTIDRPVEPVNLGGFRTVDDDMYGLWLGTKDGRMIDAKGWQAPQGYDARLRPWYKAAIAADKVTFSDTYEDVALKKTVVAVAMPLRDAKGELVGVLAGNIFLDTIKTALQSVFFREQGYLFLLDQKGNVLVHPERKFVTENVFEVEEFKEIKGLFSAMLENGQGFAGYEYQNVEKIVFYRTVPISGWVLAATVPKSVLYQPLQELEFWFAGVSLCLILIVTAASLFVAQKITRPLSALGKTAKEIGDGNLKVRAAIIGSEPDNDEIAKLAFEFNKMAQNLAVMMSEKDAAEKALQEAHDQLEEKVEVRTQELMAANQELQAMNQEISDTLEQLKAMQAKLVRAEKMAALGRLVGGMAHEINTPIGVGVTAATHLSKISEEFILLAQGSITRKELKDYSAECQEIAKLIFMNLYRASDLIRNLKTAAIDQAAEAKRWFNLKDYLDETVMSLRPRLKETKIMVQVECPDNLMIYAPPGVFVQIVTNLIINSLVHGYDADMSGCIRLKAWEKENIVEISYSDDGKGIEADVLSKIFDPFFTTKRGSGGAGLGLYLIHTIITQQLGGSIECRSERDKGCLFLMTVPTEKPEITYDKRNEIY